VDLGDSTGKFFIDAASYMNPEKSLCVEMLGDLAQNLFINPIFHNPAQKRYVRH
jgi:hypothetical protein